jgi:hypothetical protein
MYEDIPLALLKVTHPILPHQSVAPAEHTSNTTCLVLSGERAGRMVCSFELRVAKIRLAKNIS